MGLPKKIFFLTVFFVFLFFVSGFIDKASTVNAQCWCQNGNADGCRCERTGTGGFGPVNVGGINIYCATEGELYSYDARLNPICGTAAETIPYCSYHNDGTCDATCWGTYYTYEPGNVPRGDCIYCEWNQQIINYNTFYSTQNDPGGCGGTVHNITYCGSNLYCCGDPGRCIDPGLTYQSCEPQDPSIDPPASICSMPPPGGGFSSPAPPTQRTPIPGYPVRCDSTDVEFHTYRPYENTLGSLCNDRKEDLALFCGNTLMFRDYFTISASWSSPPPTCTSTADTNCCDPSSTDGIANCRWEFDIDKDIAISILGADLPIMGNTENVLNYLNDQDDPLFTDAVKINEYVSWYLNGIINNPREYSYLFDPNDPMNSSDSGDLRKIVDFSGPLKKLTPHRKYRDYIGGSGDYSNPDDYSGQIQRAGIDRHNQHVGCVTAIGSRVTHCNRGFVAHIPITDWLNNLPPKEEHFSRF